jgi:hypothetical protein
MSAPAINMCNGWDFLSPARGPESYPTPAPSPQIDDEGIPLPPGAPKFRALPLPQMGFGAPPSHLHPILRYANCPCIEYDVRQRPSCASAPHSRLEWAHESATNPPSSQVIITCHVLPRPFVVRPSGRNYHFVTVHDILLAVHRATRAAEAFYYNPGLNSWTSRPGETATALWWTVPVALSGRYMWKGLSEEIAPGNWLLHIE